MSTSQSDMDALDSLLAETLGSDLEESLNLESAQDDSVTEAVKPASVSPVSSQAKDQTTVWADVIERATATMQDSAYMNQQATQKTIELAKQQSASIKELSDASTGWRNLSRQTYEDIIAAKKNIRIMSVIALVAVITGSALTTGISWIQSRDIKQDNRLLQVTIEEYVDAMSKELSTKLGNMVALVEEIPMEVPEPRKEKRVIEEGVASVESVDKQSVESVVVSMSPEQLRVQQESFAKLETQLEKALSIIGQQQAQQDQILAQLEALRNAPKPTAAPAPIAPVAVTAPAPMPSPVNAAALTQITDRQDELVGLLAQTQKSLTQLQGRMTGLEQQVEKTDQHIGETQEQLKEQLKKQAQTIQNLPATIEQRLTQLEQMIVSLKQEMKQWQNSVVSSNSAASSDSNGNKLVTDQLLKVQKELFEIKQMQQTLKATKSQTAAPDRELNDQVIRLQRDIRDLKQQQNGIKDQVQDVKQSLPTQQKPYQYRLDVESYPR